MTMFGWSVNCCGQFMPVPYSPRVMAGAWQIPWADIFIMNDQPAALAALKFFSAGVYGENYYRLPDLMRYKLAVGIPLKSGAIGINADHFNADRYAATKLGVAYGKSLGKASLGLRFNYEMLTLPGYGSSKAIGTELGMCWQLTKELQAGLQMTNPVSSRVGSTSWEKLAYRYALHLGYSVSQQVLMGIGIAKDEGKPVNAQIGLHYIPIAPLIIRLGMDTSPPVPWGEIGWMYQSFRIAVYGRYQFPLGFTPGMVFCFLPHDKKRI